MLTTKLFLLSTYFILTVFLSAAAGTSVAAAGDEEGAGAEVSPGQGFNGGRKRTRSSSSSFSSRIEYGSHRGYGHHPGSRGVAAGYDVRPTFGLVSQNVTFGPGERAVLKCRVDNLGTKTVTWRRQDDVHPLTIGLFVFVADPRIQVDYSQRTNEWSLLIQDVKPSDEGLYHCQISTKDADLDSSYDVTLNVKAFHRYYERRPYSYSLGGIQVTGTEYVERGNAIELVCNATGRPEPPHTVDWYKDGEKINSNADTGIIITKKIEARMLISMLAIRSSKMSDAGVYVCRSPNRDAGMRNVIVLNVSSTVEKRGTSVERIRSAAELVSGSASGQCAICRLPSLLLPLIVTSFVAFLFPLRRLNFLDWTEYCQ